MKLKLDRLISVATLLVSVVAVYVALHRTTAPATGPAPATQTSTAPAVVEQRAETRQQTPAPSQPGLEGHLSSKDVYAAVSQAMAALSQRPSGGSESDAKAGPSSSMLAQIANGAQTKSSGASQGTGPATGLDDNTLAGELGSGEPNIKDYSVNMEGDQVVGRFLTQVAGKDVWVTVRGHMACKDGYATFDPTEFKVGDINVPVSLVNGELQKKLAEQRSRLSCTPQ